MAIIRQTPNDTKFNQEADLPFNLRIKDFALAMQDVYDLFHDVNTALLAKGLRRLDDIVRSAIMSGVLSDLVTSGLASHSTTLVENTYHNGHPDLIVNGIHPNNAVKSGAPEQGVEIKCTQKRGGAVDTHGARKQWFCVFVYRIDDKTEPLVDRAPLTFTEIYLGHVEISDFRNNPRGALGTRTSTLDKQGIQKWRQNWVYLDT